MVFISATVTEPVSHQSQGSRDSLHSVANFCPLIYEQAWGLWSSLLTFYDALYISKRSRPVQSSQWGGSHSQAGKQQQDILDLSRKELQIYSFLPLEWNGILCYFSPVSPRAHPLWLSYPCVYWHWPCHPALSWNLLFH